MKTKTIKKRKEQAMGEQTCADVSNTMAGRHTCGARIKWVKSDKGKTDDEAKALVEPLSFQLSVEHVQRALTKPSA